MIGYTEPYIRSAEKAKSYTQYNMFVHAMLETWATQVSETIRAEYLRYAG